MTNRTAHRIVNRPVLDTRKTATLSRVSIQSKRSWKQHHARTGDHFDRTEASFSIITTVQIVEPFGRDYCPGQFSVNHFATATKVAMNDLSVRLLERRDGQRLHW